jgi:Inner membrane protein YgaP-like, transmembrane domain
VFLPETIPPEGEEVAMSRRERVASTPFGQFMASTAGRITRGVIGIALIVAGLLVGAIAGWVFGAFGAVLLAAGLFDFCVITGLIDNIWSGREVRARGHRGAARTA